jgi:hypothetical protein
VHINNTRKREKEQYQWRQIDKQVRWLFRQIKMPLDQGQGILEYALNTNNSPLLGVSDTSVINGNGRHSWILTTVDKQYINDPEMMICGSGVVGGHSLDLSSSRAELQGQTALAIIINHLAKIQNTPQIPIIQSCDSQGVIKGCQNRTQTRLKYRRQTWTCTWSSGMQVNISTSHMNG